MEKWIGWITCAALIATSVHADAVPQAPEQQQEEVGEEMTPEKKQVGKAADDGSRTGSGAGKFVLAASAIAVAVAALVLVSRHHGRNK